MAGREDGWMGQLITLTEASERAGVSLVTLRKIIRQHRITLYRNPRDARERLVDTDQLDAALRPTPIEDQNPKAAGWISTRAA